jgi:hypothetical protein
VRDDGALAVATLALYNPMSLAGSTVGSKTEM